MADFPPEGNDLQATTSSPKILFIDLETAPLLGWAWQIWETNVIDVSSSWYILSFAASWITEKRVRTWALPDYSNYKKNKEDDSALVKDLWKLLDEADIVVAHNGDKFDIRKSNARFILHGLKPPSPYKTVDTLKIARKHFGFLSNKLNDLGAYLGEGRKLPHTGFHLWKSCMSGVSSAWEVMRRYNAQDVRLLKRVYFRFRPWATTHHIVNNGRQCPACGSSHVERRGSSVSGKRIYQQLHCKVDACGRWFRGDLIKQ